MRWSWCPLRVVHLLVGLQKKLDPLTPGSHLGPLACIDCFPYLHGVFLSMPVMCLFLRGLALLHFPSNFWVSFLEVILQRTLLLKCAG